MLPRPLVFVLLSATTVAACGDPRVQSTTRFASDFSHGGHTVSVLGVYRDGRMAVDAWADLSPALAPALGSAPCDIFYESLDTLNSPLAEAIDTRARTDGPTDELLAQLAPAAKGDVVLVITISGALRAKTTGAGPAPAAPYPSGGRGRRQRGGTPSQPVGSESRRLSEFSAVDGLELSALLFSVAAARSVALVSIRYLGSSVDEARKALGTELARALPGMTCAGWNREGNGKLDPARIREGGEP
jgi:hypothetical protein